MPLNNLKLADEFAADYDKSVSTNNWQGPEIVFNLLQNVLHPEAVLLDLGIGTGESAIRFRNAGHKITGLDGSAKMLEQCAKKKIASELIHHNLEKFPYPIKTQHFDSVIANGVFHLIPHLNSVFDEVKRTLKKDGLFVFTFDNAKAGKGYSKKENGVWEMTTKTGVTVYKYSEQYISGLLDQKMFKKVMEQRFLAYANPELQKSFVFTAIVARLHAV